MTTPKEAYEARKADRIKRRDAERVLDKSGAEDVHDLMLLLERIAVGIETMTEVLEYRK